jgi:hypothetical protein
MNNGNDHALPRQIAVCRSFEELRNAIAAFCEQQRVTRRDLDRRAGLAEGHSGKLLSPRARKKFGSVSFRWVLAALDLEIVVQRRPDAAATAIEQNHADVNASERKPAPNDWRRNRGSAWGKRMAARRALTMTAEQRSASARKAAQARWEAVRGFANPPTNPQSDVTNPA